MKIFNYLWKFFLLENDNKFSLCFQKDRTTANPLRKPLKNVEIILVLGNVRKW